jgi:4'-phosphopantetheinyl transferase
VTGLPDSIFLPTHEVHVWRIPLIASRQEREALNPWLDAHERAALARMVSRAERERREVAWGRRRAILTRYLDCAPENVGFERRPTGRPEIASPEGSGLQFSLAHSGSFGLLAVARCSVGVDVEEIDAEIDTERLAARFFTDGEAEYLRGLAREDRVSACFRLWVLKEAYVKAIGEGVPSGLSKHEFSLDGPRLLGSSRRVEEERTRGKASFSPKAPVPYPLSLFEIPASEGTVAALAVLDCNVRLTIQ